MLPSGSLEAEPSKVTVRGASPLAGEKLKLAVGEALGAVAVIITWDSPMAPSLSVTVSPTVWAPAVVNSRVTHTPLEVVPSGKVHR